MMTIEVIPMAKAPRPGDRRCLACDRVKPEAQFFSSGHGGRRRTCIRCLQDADRRKRIARGGKDRHPRYNARGQVWCNHCEKYVDRASFKPHPNRPGVFWSYCIPCTRELDRARYARKMSDFDRALADIERRTQSKRKQQARIFAERRGFLQDSIRLLRRRGLTKSEIVKLTDTSFANLLEWERGNTKRPTKAVCDRFAIVVRETMGFPIGEPSDGRRLPHPAMGELLAVCLPQVQEISVRNTWKNRRSA